MSHLSLLVRTRPVPVATLACLCLLVPTAAQGDNWPQWRGPHGDGHAETTGLLKWSDEDVAWAKPLPGVGQSSPIVWQDKVFLTAAEQDGGNRIVLCFALKSGELLWKQTAWTGDPEKVHAMNPWASSTCVTDGKRLVAFFGKGGLHCYGMDGEKQWSRQLGDFENPWGTAASPIIVGDIVVQNCDAEDDSFIAGFDLSSGTEVWRTNRERLRGWSTPLVVGAPGKETLLLNGETGVRCYEAKSGKELWFRKGDTGRGTPTVTPTGHGSYVVLNGRSGDMFAVKADGNEVWRTRRKGGRDLPSPIVIDDKVLIVALRPGTVSSYLSKTGQEAHERKRLKGSFAASPVVIQGHAVIPNEDGEVHVLKPGDNNVQVVSVNAIKPRVDGEIFRASVTPVENGVLIRSTRTLYFVKK